MVSPDCEKNRTSRRIIRGFTLIELLVVIAIISLLVSILVPSLQKARDLARLSVCASNLRNLGLSTQFYAQDWGDHLPSYTFFGGIPYLLNPYLEPPDPSSVFSFSPMWICPDQPTPSASNPYTSPAYAANAASMRGGQIWGVVFKQGKVSEVPNVADKIWMTEGLYGGTPGTYVDSNVLDYCFWSIVDYANNIQGWVQECYPHSHAMTKLVSYRHDGMKAHDLRFDMHVELHPFDEYETADKHWEW